MGNGWAHRGVDTLRCALAIESTNAGAEDGAVELVTRGLAVNRLAAASAPL